MLLGLPDLKHSTVDLFSADDDNDDDDNDDDANDYDNGVNDVYSMLMLLLLYSPGRSLLCSLLLAFCLVLDFSLRLFPT